MKIVFWGSDSFAIATLINIRKKHEIGLVVCQPDKKAGRNRKTKQPATKAWALDNGIAVLQPDTLKDNKEFFYKLNQGKCDLFLVISYGKIIPLDILNIPVLGSINLHASLLPKLRGASPIQTALLKGFAETGLSVQFMTKKMDAGDIITQISQRIHADWDFGELRLNLSLLSVDLVDKVLTDLEQGNVRQTPQIHGNATYCYKIQTADTKIIWSDAAEKITGQIRAFSPVIGARTWYKGKMIKIWQAKILEDFQPEDFQSEDFQSEDFQSEDFQIGDNWKKKPKGGEIVLARKGKLVVATGDSYLEIVKVQPENKKIINAADFINGFRPGIHAFFE